MSSEKIISSNNIVFVIILVVFAFLALNSMAPQMANLPDVVQPEAHHYELNKVRADGKYNPVEFKKNEEEASAATAESTNSEESTEQKNSAEESDSEKMNKEEPEHSEVLEDETWE